MENKHVGFIVIGIAVVLIFIIFLFQGALNDIVTATCSMETTACPMTESINKQTYLALGVVGILLILGLVMVFNKPKERVIIKNIKEKRKKLDLSGLDAKEREVIALLEKENGTIFQADLMERLGSGKVGITRLLDKLEAKQIIERKRRGMNNVVVLK